MREIEFDLEFDSFEEAFEILGLDLPENLSKSVPSLANVANFLIDNDVFSLSNQDGMDEDEFTRRLLEDYD